MILGCVVSKLATLPTLVGPIAQASSDWRPLNITMHKVITPKLDIESNGHNERRNI